MFAIVTDTSANLDCSLLQQRNIAAIPFAFFVGDQEQTCTDTAGFDGAMRSGTQVKTSQVSPQQYIDLFSPMLAMGQEILFVGMSSGISGSYHSAEIAAQQLKEVFPDARIRLVDTLSASLGEGLLVLEAAESLQNGMSVEDTIALLEKRREHQLGAFVIRTLEFLRKGGRIGRVEGAIGSLLQIKPVIYVNDEGVYNTLCKARGFSNALTAMVDEIIRRYQGHKVRLAVVHGAAYDDAVKLRDRLMERLDVVSSFISPVSPALAIHTGPGLLGAIVQLAE